MSIKQLLHTRNLKSFTPFILRANQQYIKNQKQIFPTLTGIKNGEYYSLTNSTLIGITVGVMINGDKQHLEREQDAPTAYTITLKAECCLRSIPVRKMLIASKPPGSCLTISASILLAS
ncbi:hypothetical protein [Okeania sp. KiyG1]|uniref:hypothetical protein n=1 Tax=Okeania sp. KiyG1 TaxID=2720165 RepID=UPI001924D864|nr:hypothetical protein [Okeania sp. KiyG1]